jgi:hypothetical protein
MNRNPVLNSPDDINMGSEHELRIYSFRTFAFSEQHGEGLEIVWRRGKFKESARLFKLAESIDEGIQRLKNNPPAIFNDYDLRNQDDSDKTTKFRNFLIEAASARAESTDPTLWGTDIIPFPEMSAAESLYCVLCACCRHLKIDGEWHDSEITGMIIDPKDADLAIKQKSLGISYVKISDGFILIQYYGNIGFGEYNLFKIDPNEEEVPKDDDKFEPEFDPEFEPEYDQNDPNYCRLCLDEYNSMNHNINNTNLQQKVHPKYHAYWDCDSECMDACTNPRFIKLLIRCFCMNFIKDVGIKKKLT